MTIFDYHNQRPKGPEGQAPAELVAERDEQSIDDIEYRESHGDKVIHAISGLVLTLPELEPYTGPGARISTVYLHYPVRDEHSNWGLDEARVWYDGETVDLPVQLDYPTSSPVTGWIEVQQMTNDGKTLTMDSIKQHNFKLANVIIHPAPAD